MTRLILFLNGLLLMNDVDFYRQYQFTNVKSNIDQVLAEAREEALADIEHFDVWSLFL